LLLILSLFVFAIFAVSKRFGDNFLNG